MLAVGVHLAQGRAHLFELLPIGRHLLDGGQTRRGRHEVVPVAVEGVQPDQPGHLWRVQLGEPMHVGAAQGVRHQNIGAGDVLGVQ